MVTPGDSMSILSFVLLFTCVYVNALVGQFLAEHGVQLITGLVSIENNADTTASGIIPIRHQRGCRFKVF